MGIARSEHMQAYTRLLAGSLALALVGLAWPGEARAFNTYQIEGRVLGVSPKGELVHEQRSDWEGSGDTIVRFDVLDKTGALVARFDTCDGELCSDGGTKTWRVRGDKARVPRLKRAVGLTPTMTRQVLRKRLKRALRLQRLRPSKRAIAMVNDNLDQSRGETCARFYIVHRGARLLMARLNGVYNGCGPGSAELLESPHSELLFMRLRYRSKFGRKHNDTIWFPKARIEAMIAYHRGKKLLAADKHDQAIATLHRSVTLEPDFPPARKALGEALLAGRRPWNAKTRALLSVPYRAAGHCLGDHIAESIPSGTGIDAWHDADLSTWEEEYYDAHVRAHGESEYPKLVEGWFPRPERI